MKNIFKINWNEGSTISNAVGLPIVILGLYLIATSKIEEGNAVIGSAAAIKMALGIVLPNNTDKV